MTRALARLLLACALAFAALAPGAVRAQGVAPGEAPAPAPAAPSLTATQAQAVLDVLRDDKRRAEFLTTLEGLARVLPAGPARVDPAAPAPARPGPAHPAASPAQPAATQPAPVQPAAAQSPPAQSPPAQPAPARPAAEAASAIALPLAPDSLGAELFAQASDALSSAGEQVVASVRAVNDLPLLVRWLQSEAGDPEARARILDAAWKLACVLAAALLVEWAAARALRRSRRAVARWAPGGPMAAADTPSARQDLVDDRADAADLAQDPASPDAGGLAAAEAGETERDTRRRTLSRTWRTLRKLPYALLRLALDLVPVALFAAVAYGLLGTRLGEPAQTRMVIRVAANAYVLCRVVLRVTDMLVSPAEPHLRLVHLSDRGAAYAVRWTRRIAGVAVFGYALAQTGLVFGMYRTAYEALLKLFALIVHAFLIVVVVQCRAAVAARLRAPPQAQGFVAALRDWVAGIWHLAAIFYLVALWLVWAVELRGGYVRLLTSFVATSAVLVAARLVGIVVLGGLDRALRVRPETAARHPGLEVRLAAYYPVLRHVLNAALVVLTGVALLMAWGFHPVSWFARSDLGTRVLSALLLIGATVVLAVLAWEGANAAVEGHLARLTAAQHHVRAVRLRTLLPMLRTALLVVILLIVALTVLSELGVNIAPLLAGAGVVGIAVGFGSQKLVQDLINGLFLLLENAVQVGDTVTLGGQSGTVEALSIRTIRLRALDGAVHIIPFSAVTTVTNQTRDYGYAVLDVSVGLNEEPDPIADLLRDIARAMRREEKWRVQLLDELEVMGVDHFIDGAWVMRARVKTLPASRLPVMRELNRRIKVRFDELRIESPFTSHRALSDPAPTPAAASAA